MFVIRLRATSSRSTSCINCWTALGPGVGGAARTPSAASTNKIYLAVDPDVAASRMNPLIRCLAWGAEEARLPHDDEGVVWRARARRYGRPLPTGTLLPMGAIDCMTQALSASRCAWLFASNWLSDRSRNSPAISGVTLM